MFGDQTGSCPVGPQICGHNGCWSLMPSPEQIGRPMHWDCGGNKHGPPWVHSGVRCACLQSTLLSADCGNRLPQESQCTCNLFEAASLSQACIQAVGLAESKLRQAGQTKCEPWAARTNRTRQTNISCVPMAGCVPCMPTSRSTSHLHHHTGPTQH